MQAVIQLSICLYTNILEEIPLSVSQAKARLSKPCDDSIKALLKDLLEIGFGKSCIHNLSTSILCKVGVEGGFLLSTSNPTAL